MLATYVLLHQNYDACTRTICSSGEKLVKNSNRFFFSSICAFVLISMENVCLMEPNTTSNKWRICSTTHRRIISRIGRWKNNKKSESEIAFQNTHCDRNLRNFSKCFARNQNPSIKLNDATIILRASLCFQVKWKRYNLLQMGPMRNTRPMFTRIVIIYLCYCNPISNIKASSSLIKLWRNMVNANSKTAEAIRSTLAPLIWSVVEHETVILTSNSAQMHLLQSFQ